MANISKQLTASLFQLGLADEQGNLFGMAKSSVSTLAGIASSLSGGSNSTHAPAGGNASTVAKKHIYQMLDIPYVKGMHPFKDHYVLVVEVLKGERLMWSFAFPNDTSDECIQCFVGIGEHTVSELSKAMSPLLQKTSGSKDLSKQSVVGVLHQVRR